MDGKRVEYFDNLKAILIFLVVFGHSLLFIFGQLNLIKFLVLFIYVFHMPMFIFISGYFSKKDYKKSMVLDFLIPAFIVSSIYMFIEYKTFFVNIFVPPFVFWYLYSLVFWRLVIKDVAKIKGILFFSLILYLICGIYQLQFNAGSLMRSIGFLFFFVLGYKAKESDILKVKNMKKGLFILILLIVFLFSYYIIKNDLLIYGLLCKNKAFVELGVNNIDGVLTNLFINFPLLILLSLLILKITPKKRLCFTYIGRNTMPIYLFHMFLIFIAEYVVSITGMLDFSKEVTLLFMFLVSVLIVLLLGSNRVLNIYNKFIYFINKLFLKKD